MLSHMMAWNNDSEEEELLTCSFVTKHIHNNTHIYWGLYFYYYLVASVLRTMSSQSNCCDAVTGTHKHHNLSITHPSTRSRRHNCTVLFHESIVYIANVTKTSMSVEYLKVGCGIHSGPWIRLFFLTVKSSRPFTGAGRVWGDPLCSGLKLPAYRGRGDEFAGIVLYVLRFCLLFLSPLLSPLFASFSGGRFNTPLFFLFCSFQLKLIVFKLSTSPLLKIQKTYVSNWEGAFTLWFP